MTIEPEHSCQATYRGPVVTIVCVCGWSVAETNPEPGCSLAHGAAALHLARQASDKAA